MGKPLLVTSSAPTLGRQARPGLAAIDRAPHVITKGLEEAEVEEASCFIRVQHRIAAEHVIFQHTRKRPRGAAVCGESPATLPKVGRHAVDCRQPIVILLPSVGSTAIEDSLAASPTMLFPLLSTFT